MQWVVPDGPAWSEGLRPGDVVLVPQGPRGGEINSTPQWGMVLRHENADGPTVTFVPAPVPAIDAFDAAIFCLGIGMLALGVVVLVKAADAVAGWAFWRMSLCVSAALAFVPPGSRGMLWVLVLHFAALRLAGPAVVALAWALPAHPDAPRMGASRWLWLPAGLLLLVYPLCWKWPVPLFAVVQVLDGAALLGYIIIASLLLLARLWRGREAPLERAQLILITLGIAGGFAPFLLLTVLPLLVTGQAVLPFQMSILALVLLPLCVAVAIVHAEFLGITGLVHRRPLRLAVGSVLLASVGTGVWMVDSLLVNTLSWPGPAVAAAVAVFGVLLYSVLYPGVTHRIEPFFLRDTYDPARAFLDVSVELTAATSAEALTTHTVERLGSLLDLTFAAIVSPTTVVPFHHPRS